MRNTKEAFKDVTTKEELQDRLIENSQCLTANCQNEEMALRIIEAIPNLSSEEENIILKYVHYVDKKMNGRGQWDFNKARKIPAIIVGINCMLNHFNEIRGLSFGALMLLSMMLNFADDSLYAELFNIYPNNLLEYIVTRESNYHFQYHYACVLEKMYDEGKNSEEILAYLKSQTSESLIAEGDAYEEKEMEALMYNDSRRI